jgi:hypothetical protein
MIGQLFFTSDLFLVRLFGGRFSSFASESVDITVENSFHWTRSRDFRPCSRMNLESNGVNRR